MKVNDPLRWEYAHVYPKNQMDGTSCLLFFRMIFYDFGRYGGKYGINNRETSDNQGWFTGHSKTEELLCFGEVPSGCNDASGENESAKSHLTRDPSFLGLDLSPFIAIPPL